MSLSTGRGLMLIVDCIACQHGNHEGHVGGSTSLPGLLGGWSCPCTGDCGERNRDQAVLLTPPPDPLQVDERRWTIRQNLHHDLSAGGPQLGGTGVTVEVVPVSVVAARDEEIERLKLGLSRVLNERLTELATQDPSALAGARGEAMRKMIRHAQEALNGEDPGPWVAIRLLTDSRAQVAALTEEVERLGTERDDEADSRRREVAEVARLTARVEAQAQVLSEVRGVLTRPDVENYPVLAATVERLIVQRNEAEEERYVRDTGYYDNGLAEGARQERKRLIELLTGDQPLDSDGLPDETHAVHAVMEALAAEYGAAGNGTARAVLNTVAAVLSGEGGDGAG